MCSLATFIKASDAYFQINSYLYQLHFITIFLKYLSEKLMGKHASDALDDLLDEGMSVLDSVEVGLIVYFC